MIKNKNYIFSFFLKVRIMVIMARKMSKTTVPQLAKTEMPFDSC